MARRRTYILATWLTSIIMNTFLTTYIPVSLKCPLEEQEEGLLCGSGREENDGGDDDVDGGGGSV